MATELNNLYLASGGTLAVAFGTSASKIYGSTTGAETVTIAVGATAVLDSSFNSGLDTIRFTGNAASYSIVKVNASTVRITDSSGTSVTIPVGSTGTAIQFADATRSLSGSSQGLFLGGQTVPGDKNADGVYTPLALTAGTAPAVVESYTLSVNTPTVTEGDTGSKTLSYKLTLDTAPTSTVTVSYETLDTGTASANDDFVPAAGTVTFAAGQTVAFVSITVLGDTTVEAPETIKLNLSGSKLVASVEATGTIVDNEVAAVDPTFFTVTSGEIAIADAQNVPISVNVGDTGSKTVTIQSDANAADRGVIVNGNASVSVTAGAAGDIINVSGNGNNTIDAGAGNGNDTISIFGSGNNTIIVGAGDDTVVGGSGNDTIIVASGALGAGDSFDGGAGEDTVRISGDGNVADYGFGGNLVNIERLVLDGTSVTITEANLEAAIAGGLLSITGSSSSSVITVNSVGGTTIDLTGLNLSGVKELKVNADGAGTATLVLSATQIAAIGTITELAGDTLSLNTTVAGYQALGAKADGVTVTISDTVQNLIDAGSTISGVSATLGTASVAQAESALASGLTVSYALVDTAANLALANVAAFTSATTVTVSDNATAAQATAIQSSIAAANAITAPADDITEPQLTLNVRDTASNVTNYLGDAIDADTVAAAPDQALTVAQANALAALNANATFKIVDTAANLFAGRAGAGMARASEITSNDALTVAQVSSINTATTDIKAGYALTDAAGILSLAGNAAIVAAAGNVTVTDASIDVVTALAVEALLNTGTTSYVLQDTITSLLAASSQVVASATAVSVTGAAALSVSQVNSLVSKYTTAKVNDGTLPVEDTFGNLLSLTAGSVSEASAITISSGVGTVADAVALKTLTGAKMPATFTVTDSFAAVSGGLATASTLTLLDTARVTINVTGTPTVANITALNASLAAGVGAKTAVNGYSLSDTAAVLALLANNTVVAAATAVTVTGDASVAQIDAINLLGSPDPTGFALVDTAGNLVAGVTAVDRAGTVTVTGTATVANIATIAGSFTTTGADAVYGTDLVYAISDAPSAFNDADAATLAILNGASTATMVGNKAQVFAVGLTTAERDVADVIIVQDLLATLGTLTAGELAEVDRLTITDSNLTVIDATATAVNALAAAKPTTYTINGARASFTTLTGSTAEQAAKAALVLGATEVVVDSNGSNTLDVGDTPLTVAQFNTLDGLTNGTIKANITGTVAQLSAADAATAISSALAASGTITLENTAANVSQADTLRTRTVSVGTLVVTDTAANIQAAATATVTAVNSFVVSDNGVITGSVALVSKVYAANTNTGSSYGNYAIVDTATNVVAAGATDAVNFAQSVTVTGTANQAQANTLGGLTAMGAITYNMSDTAANVAGASANGRNRAADITATDNATVLEAVTIDGATNTGSTSYAISDTSAALATSVAGQKLAINNATGTVTASDNATALQANAIAALTKAVVFNVSDTPTALAASTGLGEAVNIISTGGTATTAEAATIMAVANTGTTTISAVSGTAAAVNALTLGANDTITTLTVTGTTAVADAVAIAAKDLGANIGTLSFATISGTFAALKAAATTVNLATVGVTVTDAMTVAQAAELDALITPALSYGITDSLNNIMADTTPLGAVDNAALYAGKNVTVTDTTLTVAQATALQTVGATSYTYAIKDNDASLVTAINASDAALVGATSVTSANGATLTLETINSQLAIVGTKTALDGLSTVLQGAEKVYEVSVSDLAATPDFFVGLNIRAAYRVTDTIANLTGGNALLPGAVSLVATDAATVAQATALNSLGANVKVFSITDTAAAIFAAGDGAATALTVIDLARNVVVTGTATYVQAVQIAAEDYTGGSLTMSISDTGAALAGASGVVLSRAVNITATGSTAHADAVTILAASNTGATSIATVTGTSAELAALTLTANDTITAVTPSNPATVAQVTAMSARAASITAYSLDDTAAGLLTATSAQLNAATNITANTAVTAALATTIVNATNTGTNLFSIADTAANVRGADVAVLGADANDVVVITDTTVSAAEATLLRAFDTANAGFAIVQGANTTPQEFVIRDSLANLTAPANAAAVEASNDVQVDGTLTVAEANLVRAAATLDITPTYNLSDTYSRLVAGIAATVGATNVNVTNQVTVAQANSAVANFSAATLTMNVRDTASLVAAGLAASSAGLTAAGQVSVSTSATVAQAGRLSELPSSKLIGGYAIADTAAAVTGALNIANAVDAADRATVLGATTITLSNAATVDQALGVRGTEARGLYTIPGISYAIQDSAGNILAGLAGSDAAGIDNATSLTLASGTAILVSQAATLTALANFVGYDVDGDGDGVYAIADDFAAVQAADTALVLGAAAVTANGTDGVGETIDMTGISRAVSVNGLAGADTIFGTEFADTITGGSGADNLGGGNGNDTFVFAAGSSGGVPSGTLLDTITDFAAGDIIDYSAAITIVTNGAAATAGVASINAAGLASFDAADNTLDEMITAVEAGIAIGTVGPGQAGQTAMFKFGTDSYVFISDGTDGVDANDVLIKLAGIDVTSGAYNEIVIDSGNFTLG